MYARKKTINLKNWSNSDLDRRWYIANVILQCFTSSQLKGRNKGVYLMWSASLSHPSPHLGGYMEFARCLAAILQSQNKLQKK